MSCAAMSAVGGVFGAGRATAMVMAEDLGIEFDGIRVT